MSSDLLEKRFKDLHIKEVPAWLSGNFSSVSRIKHTLSKPFASYMRKQFYRPLGIVATSYILLSMYGAYLNFDFNEACEGEMPRQKKYIDQLRQEIMAKGEHH